MQRLNHPALAETPAGQRARLGQRISRHHRCNRAQRNGPRDPRNRARRPRPTPVRGPCASDMRAASPLWWRTVRRNAKPADAGSCRRGGQAGGGLSRPFCATLADHQEQSPGAERLRQCVERSGRDGVLHRSARQEIELAPPGATATRDDLPRRLADFATLGDALDYAAQGPARAQFPRCPRPLDPRLSLFRAAHDALAHARRLVSLGIKPGDRIALIAETGPEFAACFFGAVYAGAWPVPLPLPTSFGGRELMSSQLAVQLDSCDPALLLFPAELAEFALARPRQARHRCPRLGSVDEHRASCRTIFRSAARRHRLSAIFERFDPLSARRCGHPSGPARQSPLPRLRA